MYVDSKEDRVLMRNGVSMVSDFAMARSILLDEPITGTVLRSEDSETYELFYKERIYTDEEVEAFPTPDGDHKHSDSDLDYVWDYLISSVRFRHDPKNIERITEELEFFDRTNNIEFLLYLIDLVNKFKENGVVWGVGRGSSCGSYVLYLIEVHDINPMEYNISFSDLSKE